MAAVGNDTTVPTVGVHSYAVCSTVDVEAVSDSGSLFVAWTGNVANTLAPLTQIAMTGDQSVTATRPGAALSIGVGLFAMLAAGGREVKAHQCLSPQLKNRTF
jgi:hypothetical protein